MKDQQPSTHQTPRRQGGNIFSRLYTNPVSFITLLVLSYILLLAISYGVGYLNGSSFRKDFTFVLSKAVFDPKVATARSSKLVQNQVVTWCADPVPPELVRQTVINLVYNGVSPYEAFVPPTINLLLHPERIKGWSSYEAIYKSLIQKVRPKTIIKFSTFMGASATYMANLTRHLKLETQILCLDDFHGWPGFRDLFEDITMPNNEVMLLNQFMQNVISQNATESILPVPLSTSTALEKLCEWGIYGDLIEVDVGRNFHSAWSDINRAYKLLRPGGVLFGHNYFTSYYNKGTRQAVRLFARVNKFRVKTDGEHWMIDSA